MVDYALEANSFGSFHVSMANNGTDDSTVVKIGPNFSGTIFVSSSDVDGETDVASFELPAGWSLTQLSSMTSASVEPTWQQTSYTVHNEDGTSVGYMVISANEYTPVCFGADTQVETPDGFVEIRHLKVGDYVCNLAGQPCQIRWMSVQRFSEDVLRANHRLQPLKIQRGALGAGRPYKDLVISRQHRLMIEGAAVRQKAGLARALVAAGKLISCDGVERFVPKGGVEYRHILLDTHDVILANGIGAETLLLGKEAMRSLGPDALESLNTYMPEFASYDMPSEDYCVIPEGAVQKKIGLALAREVRGYSALAS